MIRQLLVLIVSTVTLVPYAVKAQEPIPKKAAQQEFNQVYVKIILPGDSADRDKHRPLVESWIAGELEKRGQRHFTAATEWVSLDLSPFEATSVWDGKRDGKQCHCPVFADIPDRAKGRIEILIEG